MRIFLSLLVAATAIVLTGCPGATTPDTTPAIHGTLKMYDEYSNLMPPEAGVTISAASTDEGYSTITDADGTWRFTSIPKGSYVISASREGFVGWPDGSLVAENTTYTGTPVTDPLNLRIGRPIVATMIGSPRISYDTSGGSTTGMTVFVDTKAKQPWRYNLYITENENASCSEYLVAESYLVTPVDGVAAIPATGLYTFFRERYGPSFDGQFLYLQVRPAVNDVDGNVTRRCLQPSTTTFAP